MRSVSAVKFRRYWQSLVLVLAYGAAFPPSPLRAQEPEGDKPAAQAAKPPDREQTIYIPYTKLREVFEKNGRGVFLPYEKFQALWNAAREKEARPADVKPPVSVIVAEIENEATVGKDVMQVAAKLKLEILAEGWHEIVLGLADAAILSAKLGDDPARVVFDPNVGYKLLVEKKGKEPTQLALSLEYAKAFTKSPGQNSVTFLAPQAPVNRWRVKIPEAGVKVNIHPLIAATEAPANADDKPQTETVILAFVGASPSVRIDWTPKAEGATGLAALATVQAQQEVLIDEGVVRTRVRLVYDITRAELSQLLIEVPADHKVVNVFDPNVRQWEVKSEGASQQINVQLFQPVKGTQNLTLELERFHGEMQAMTITAPVVKALNVGRQQGVVVVSLSGDLRAEAVKRTGLLQLDAGELPPPLNRQTWAFAYRYAAVPFDLALAVEKLQPKINVEELVETYLEPEQITVNLLAIYTIERAGVFQLEFDVPADYEVRSVRGQAAAGAEAAVVDSHHLEGDPKTKLIVNLSKKALGKVGLLVELQKRLTDPNLLSPTGAASDITLAIPRVAKASVERSTGRAIVNAPESLRLNPKTQDGLRSVSLNEALAGMETMRANRFPLLRPVLSYVYTTEPASLVAAVERRKPYISVAQLLTARIEAGVVKYEAKFNYDIRYSSVKSLRIDLPAALASDIRNQTPGVRERTIDPPPADLTANSVAWSFAGESEFLGAATVVLTWEKKIEKLEIGKSVDLVLPVLKPMGVDLAWGQIVLSKSETIDVQPSGEPRGLRPIDPQHDLMNGITLADAARAFEFHEDWELKVTATRYDLQEVKRTSIEMGVVRMVATRSNQVAVQGLFRVRSALQRLAVQLPANAELDSQPLKINGSPVSLEKGDKGELFVPLVGQTPETPFNLELRYTLPGGPARLELPEFLGEPAAQTVYLCAYLPEELVWLGKSGDWADENDWVWDGPFDRRPVPKHADSDLLARVYEGCAASGGAAGSFQTGGRMYLFSALRPRPGPAGALSLTTMNETWLHVLVFLAVAAMGLAMLRQPLGNKLLTAAFMLALLVLLGVFLPTFSKQIMDGVLYSALALVVLSWLVWLAKDAAGSLTTIQWPRPVVAATPFVPASEFQETPPPATPPVEPPPANPSEGGQTNG